MKKENIYFPIEDEIQLEMVSCLLKKNNQLIDNFNFDFYYGEPNLLQFTKEDGCWFIGGNHLNKEKITFIDLIDMLKTINYETSSGKKIQRLIPDELFKKPFRRGDVRKDVILDANGHKVFKLNKGQYSDDLINKILNSINN